MQTTAAGAKIANYLANSTDRQIADTLEKAIIGTDETARELGKVEHLIRREARHRAGPAANRAADKDWAVFRDKWGITDGMTEEQLDTLFDAIPQEDLDALPGEWAYLVAELRR